MSVKGAEYSRQRTEQMQEDCVRNKLKCLRDREGSTVREKERTCRVGQIIQVFVPKECRVAFTQATVGSHQREANHSQEGWRFREGDSLQTLVICLMTGLSAPLPTTADNMGKLLKAFHGLIFYSAVC